MPTNDAQCEYMYYTERAWCDALAAATISLIANKANRARSLYIIIIGIHPSINMIDTIRATGNRCSLGQSQCDNE